MCSQDMGLLEGWLTPIGLGMPREEEQQNLTLLYKRREVCEL